MAKRTIRLNESQLNNIIRRSVKRVLTESMYDQQWEDEIKIFLKGLKSGNYFDLGDDTIGVEWKVSAENDPRFITFTYGDRRLRDDHFCIQHSRPLTDNELKDIRDAMLRLGMVEEYQFDNDYELYTEEY